MPPCRSITLALALASVALLETTGGAFAIRNRYTGYRADDPGYYGYAPDYYRAPPPYGYYRPFGYARPYRFYAPPYAGPFGRRGFYPYGY